MSQHPVTPGGSRRSFLKKAGLAVPATALLAAGVAKTAQAAAYKLPELYPGWNERNFAEIRDDENAHVEALLGILGNNARPRPNFKNIAQPSVLLFVEYADVLENTGSGAYLAAGPAIYSKEYLAAALSIAEVEAYHSGYLNTLVNLPIVPHASNFVVPFTIAGVIENASYFLVDLNGGPPLSFDPSNPSPQNDIDILNFALALEYLEQDFYNVNVPVFFG